MSQRGKSAVVALAVAAVGLSGCSFHGLQSVYHQQAEATKTLHRISQQLGQIEQELRKR